MTNRFDIKYFKSISLLILITSIISYKTIQYKRKEKKEKRSPVGFIDK